MQNRKKHLSVEEKNQLYALYNKYKSSSDIFLKDLEQITFIDRTTIGKYYKKIFGQDYINTRNIKIRIKHKQSKEHKDKISIKLKGKSKFLRSIEHRKNLSLAFKGKSYEERFGERAFIIKNKIRQSNINKKRNFKNKELWKKNLSNSLKGRKVWNKGKKGLQIAWNKKKLPENEIINMYENGKSSKQIASIFNISRYPILELLKKNNIQRKTSKEFLKGKSFEQLYGEEKANRMKKNIKEKNKGRIVTWNDKISQGIKEHYKKNPVSEERRIKFGIFSKNLWKNPEYRAMQVQKHKEYLKNNPQELERLKSMQLNRISKIELKMLKFLKQNFIEDRDFYFDKQDTTGNTFYRPDFQFPKKKIIIELYGYYKHFTQEGKQKDKIREYYLKKAGWKVYKFNNLEIERNYLFEKTKERVLEVLKDG